MQPQDIERLAVVGFHLGVGLFVVGAVAFELLRRDGPLRNRGSLLHLLLGAVPFVIASLVVRWGPVHDHLAFIARGECAYRYLCEAMFPWSGSALDLFGAVQRLLPLDYSPWTIVAAGFALEVGTLLVMFAAVRELAGRTSLAPRADATGTWALLLLGTNLAYVRVATSGTVWSLIVFWLFCALYLATRATRARAVRPRRGARVVAALAAVLALALAASGMAATLPLILVAPLAVLVWSRPDPHRPRSPLALAAGAVAIVIAAILVAAPTLDTLEAVADTGAHRRNFLMAITESSLTNWRQVSFATAALALIGAGVIAARQRQALPVLVAFVLMEAVLATEIRWESNYPTYYIHMHLSGAFIAVLGAIAAVALLGRVQPGARRRWATAGLAVLVVAGTALADRAARFATEKRVLDQEVAMLSRVLERLPPHDCLVRPPIWLEPEGFTEGCDPVEVAFPTASYREARRRAGVEDACVVSYRDLLEGRVDTDQRLMAYVGSSLVSWTSCELVDGAVPEDTFHRRPLRELDAEWVRTPGATWRQDTAQNRRVAQRLAADRVEDVELGFFFLTPKLEAPAP